MPIDSVARLEEAARFPHVTVALAELCSATISLDDRRRNETSKGGVNTDVIALSHRFAMLMSEYHQFIQDGIITVNAGKSTVLLRETLTLEEVLIDMKLHLDDEVP
jgi:hypothetical protein